MNGAVAFSKRENVQLSHISLVCSECGASREADMIALECAECGGPLDVEYGDPATRTIRWAGFDMPIPYHSGYPRVSMGEGHTPIVPMRSVAESLGLRSLFGKLEFMNPTGSFKDRGTATMMSVAVEHGVTAVVEDSSGNAGASVSAYAARAGIEAHVFAPSSAPQAKLGQIRVYDARTHAVPGPREASADAAVAFQRENDLVYASHNLSPYFVEGTKTFAYEVAAQMSPAPLHIVIPVGNGSLLMGCWNGYSELIAAGVVDRMPRLYAIQAEAVMPLAAEFEGVEWRPGASTLAGGIAVGSPPRKAQVLRAIRASGGAALAVSDASVVGWQKRLAASEGIFAEPTSAAAFAGLELLALRGHIRSDDVTLAPVTGFGLKDALPD